MKIRPLGTELLHADGQTDKTKPAAAFHDIAKKKRSKCVSPTVLFCVFSLNFHLKPMSVAQVMWRLLIGRLLNQLHILLVY